MILHVRVVWGNYYRGWSERGIGGNSDIDDLGSIVEMTHHSSRHRLGGGGNWVEGCRYEEQEHGDMDLGFHGFCFIGYSALARRAALWAGSPAFLNRA